MMSRPFSYYNGPGRRNTVSSSDREIEMRPLTNNSNHNDGYDYRVNDDNKNKSLSSKTLHLQDFIENLNHYRKRTNHKKEKRRGGRSGFAVNIPSRLIFHVIIIFFLIPLLLGMMLLVRALFFRLKEDETHPLHKKLPHSSLKDTAIVGGDDLQDLTSIDNVNDSLKNQTLVDYDSTMKMDQYNSNNDTISSMQQQIKEGSNKNRDNFSEEVVMREANSANFSMAFDSSEDI